MKLTGTMYNTLVINKEDKIRITEEGDQHYYTGVETPLREDAFKLDEESRIDAIAHHFGAIMDILGLDLTDDSLSGTPYRVAKMYVQEVFSGLDPQNKPDIKLFDNKYQYGEMLVEKGIKVHSFCEHHFVPIIGKAHVAYISSGKVIGLSKINRIVDYFARRPQVQERLTVQIGRELEKMLGTKDVAIVLEASHMCVSLRGIKDEGSSTVTSYYGGRFRDQSRKEEFHRYAGIS